MYLSSQNERKSSFRVEPKVLYKPTPQFIFGDTSVILDGEKSSKNKDVIFLHQNSPTVSTKTLISLCGPSNILEHAGFKNYECLPKNKGFHSKMQCIFFPTWHSKSMHSPGEMEKNWVLLLSHASAGTSALLLLWETNLFWGEVRSFIPRSSGQDTSPEVAIIDGPNPDKQSGSQSLEYNIGLFLQTTNITCNVITHTPPCKKQMPRQADAVHQRK